jgi:hypothetical protein
VGAATSIVLIAAGAILRFALTIDATIGSTTVDWNAIGDILMAVGVLGLVIAFAWPFRPAVQRGSAADEDGRRERPSARP